MAQMKVERARLQQLPLEERRRLHRQAIKDMGPINDLLSHLKKNPQAMTALKKVMGKAK